MRRLLLFCLLAGCAGRQPQDAVQAYAEALRARDVDRLWALSDASYRRAHDKEELAAYVAEHPEALDRLADRIEGRADVTAQARYGEHRIQLAFEDGAWRVGYGGVALFSADTPEGAVATFFRAIDAGRYDVVRSVMPAEFQERFGRDDMLSAYLQEMADVVDAARAVLDGLAPGLADIDGDRARLPYGSDARRAVELVKEQGRWKILDLE